MPQDNSRASLELLYSISRELATSLDIKTVLSRVLFLSTRNVAAERGSLIALDEHQNPMDAALVYNDQLTPYSIHDIQAILDQGLAGWVIRNLEPALILDTSQDERWFRRPDDDIKASGSKSAVCIPLLMGGKQLVGVLTIVHPAPRFFTQDHFSLLQAIADQAGIAIYNAILFENLQSAHKRYHDLFEDSIDPILITDWKGNILEANRNAALTAALAPEKMVKQNIFNLHEADLKLLSENGAQIHANETVRYESKLKHSSGNEIAVEVFIRKVLIEGGEYLQWIFRDISERKELDSLREELISMIYHDLRSPLSNVISGLDMLKSMVPISDQENFEPFVKIITRSTERLQRLISSLLDINRLESGQKITQESPTRVALLVKEAIEVILPNTETKRQNVNVVLPPNLPEVNVDTEMIRRVLINLLENAVKFTPGDGSISVGASLDGKWVNIWVQDSGPGIPIASHDAIFNKFTRLQKNNSPKGIGLGLAFCRLAVQAHGGKIWVENPAQQGSRFSFTIPVI